jgi:hypothetical protein
MENTGNAVEMQLAEGRRRSALEFALRNKPVDVSMLAVGDVNAAKNKPYNLIKEAKKIEQYLKTGK